MANFTLTLKLVDCQNHFDNVSKHSTEKYYNKEFPICLACAGILTVLQVSQYKISLDFWYFLSMEKYKERKNKN